MEGWLFMNNKNQRSKKLRLVALMLVLAMAFTLSLSGCTPKGNDGKSASGDYVMDPILNPLGSETICKETVELEFMMDKRDMVLDYETNAFTKKVEEKGNIEIKFNIVPSSDLASKINLTLSSGKDLPDVIFAALSNTEVFTYGEAGMFIPLNKYYENSSEYLVPRVKEFNERTGADALAGVTNTDGNIYTIPSITESFPSAFDAVIWMYEPWLKKLGLELPTTLDEYVECLKAFRDNDLNGNGKKDEIPLIDYSRKFAMDYFAECFLQAFIKTGSRHTALKDGKISIYYATEEYRDFLKWMNILYSEGLLDKTTFSQDEGTLKTLVNNKTTRVGSFVAVTPSIITAGDKRRENKEYKPVFLENGDNATIFHKNFVTTGNMYFITNACEHPEVAFRIGDFMTSEEMSIWTRYGEKGVDWVEAPEGAVSPYSFLGYETSMETLTQWGSVQNSHWGKRSPHIMPSSVACSIVTNDVAQLSKADAVKILYDRYGESLGVDPGDRVYNLILTQDEENEVTEITTAINGYASNARYNFITGGKNFDKDWDNYIKELKSLNIDRLVEIYQTAYDRMNDK